MPDPKLRVRPSRWMPAGPDDRPPAGPAELQQAAELLAGLRWTALTGAGISTDSGIPDYRGPDSPPRNPMTFQQFVSDPDFRRHYWARNHYGWHHVYARRPNAGHVALAELEARGIVVGVITQNVDLLHEEAGSKRVVDLHGNYNEVYCLTCGHRITRSELDERLLALNPGFLERVEEVEDIEIAPDADAVIEQTQDFVVAACEVCGGILKPDITYFGEPVPPERVAAAFSLVDDADALVVAGSSLAVMSGLRFVRHAAHDGKPVLIINRGITRGDKYATLRLNSGTSEALGYLAHHL